MIEGYRQLWGNLIPKKKPLTIKFIIGRSLGSWFFISSIPSFSLFYQKMLSFYPQISFLIGIYKKGSQSQSANMKLCKKKQNSLQNFNSHKISHYKRSTYSDQLPKIYLNLIQPQGDAQLVVKALGYHFKGPGFIPHSSKLISIYVAIFVTLIKSPNLILADFL